MFGVLAIAGLGAGVIVLGQVPAAPKPTLTILSPKADTYVSGQVVLQASLAGADSPPTSISFFANGQRVCDRYVPPYQCGWNAGPGIHENHIRAVASFTDGRRVVNTIRTRKSDFVDAVHVDVVQVTATVTDGDGGFVRGLPQRAFRVFEDDVPQSISHFARENIPLEVVVAIDVSSSMRESMRAVKRAVRAFLSQLRPEDQVTLVAFNDNVFTLARREARPEVRLKAVDRLAPWGGTALHDVIVKSIGLLGQKLGRRAVVVFTDGDDQSSQVPVEAVERAVEASDATLYLIGLGRATRLTSLKAILDRLAEISGGRAMHTDDLATLSVIFDQIIDELSNQYLLIYPPANSVRDDTWRRITVELEGSPYRLRARRGYRALSR